MICQMDYVIPNYDYLKENQDRIVGIFITHGHDEQMGAVSNLLVDIPDLKIYAGILPLIKIHYQSLVYLKIAFYYCSNRLKSGKKYYE